MGVAVDWYNVGRLLFSGSRGDDYLLNVLSDNATTGVQFTQSAGHVPATAAGCGYTGDGLRAWKRNDAGARTYYLYDGSDPIAELDSSGNIQATNTFGAAGLVSRRTLATNSSVFYTFDERGNVAQRLDSSGAVLSTDVYDAFGARTGTSPQYQKLKKRTC